MERAANFSELLDSKVLYQKITGLYFLFKNDDIVYIGQAVDIVARVSTHSGDENKDFDSYSYIECAQEEMTELEAINILKYEPILNKIVPTNLYYKSMDYIKKVYDVSFGTVKKFVRKNKISPIGTINFLEYYDIREFDKLGKEQTSKIESKSDDFFTDADFDIINGRVITKCL